MISLLATLALGSVPAPQTTWFVDASVVGPGSGTVADPYSRVDFAVASPSTTTGDVVLVLPGLYVDEAIDFGGKNIAVVSSGGAAVTTLRAVAPSMNSRAIARFSGGETTAATLEGFTLIARQGQFDNGRYTGGAVFCVDSGATLRDLAMTSDPGVTERPIEGGAVYVRGGELVIEGCTIVASAVEPFFSSRGGGIYGIDATLSVSDSVIRDCEGSEGGGLFFINSNVAIDRTNISGNRALALRAGGILMAGGDLSVTDSSIAHNEAFLAAGGVYLNAGPTGGTTSIFLRTRFIGNHCVRQTCSGGGLLVEFGNVSQWLLTDCHFESNMADVGGAIRGLGGEIVGCNFLENEASGGGAALSGSGSVHRSVFARNVAIDTGLTGSGALWGSFEVTQSTFIDNKVRGATSAGLPSHILGGSVRNSIVRGGTTPRIGPDLLGNPTEVTFSNVEGGYAGAGNIDVPESYWSDYRLLPDSPSIDAGDPLSLLDADGTIADLGAFPFDPLYCGIDCMGPLGTPTCAANVNSTGAAAVLASLGSDLAADDRVVLNVVGSPSGSVGYFLASQTGGSMPLGSGSQGTLCLAGSLVRFSSTILNDRGTGVVSFRLPLTDFPGTGSVQAGETWIAQYWFRDRNPMVTSNTSSALAVTFR